MKLISLIAAVFGLTAVGAEAKRPKPAEPGYETTVAAPTPAPPANGAIFQPANGYAPLTSGNRAAMVGDLVTIVLAERTQATKSNSASTDRSGSIGLSPPVTGPLSLFTKAEATMSGGGSSKGAGNAAQSNQLDGEITVTVAQVLPNGAMVVRGEKVLNLNRGNEYVRISGIVRPADIDFANRVLSTRVADARIAYSGTGEIARASRQGWLNKFFSIISPF